MEYEERSAIPSWAMEERPREKLQLKGKDALTDAELLAILIESGTRKKSAVDLARAMLSEHGHDLRLLSRLDLGDLVKFNGIGKAKAIKILAAFELARRKEASKPIDRIKVRSSMDAFQCIAPKLSDLRHEEFWLIMLNRAHKVIRIKQISSGGVTGTVVDPKVVFKVALEELACSIILCHNHPSGNLKPSKADLSITQKIESAGKTLDIQVLDHLIIANNSYFSFSDQHLMGNI